MELLNAHKGEKMKKILTIILDGFGVREEEHGNAIAQAKMPCFKSLWKDFPHSILEASGHYVGLPDGQFGNSEVCHEVIGLGKKITQKITIINDEIDSKKICDNQFFNDMIEYVNSNHSTLHLMGLLSDGGVHSHISYMLKLIPILKEKGIKKVVFHVITDGRDTGRKTSIKYINKMKETLLENNLGIIGSICGRYYAMDRDNKWERTKKYYDLVIDGSGLNIINYETAIKNCYLRDITDEFLPPMLLTKDGIIKENDAIFWLNFRPDRARQIMNSFTNTDFNEFFQQKVGKFKVWMMFKQDDTPKCNYILEHNKDESLYPIGKYFSDLKLSQARIAETEKYAHVTTFFNAELSKQYPFCDNFLVPSPKVATYDLTPKMSAGEVTKNVIKCLDKDYDFILVNYANPDMLGHTGNLNATIEGLEYIDGCLKDVVNAAIDNFYTVIILADHGNCDEMLDENDEVITTHSLYPVPFIILDKHIQLKEHGDLTMVAPTILKVMDIAIPKEMKESKNLIIED
jgi:2,3-bisphosphoglycerate-independent phosphoglycerate mutase